MRLLLATATGAAVLLGGVGLTAGTASAAADDITGASASGAYVPNTKDVEATISFTLKNPLGTKDKREAVSIEGADITPPGKSAKPVTISYSAPADPGADKEPPSSATGTGKFTITKDDPAGDWTLNIKVRRGDAGAAANTLTVKVTGKQGITSASVNPDPVNLRKGRDVKVDVRATVKDASNVSAQLVSDDTNEYYDLGSLSQDADGVYTGTTYFSDDTADGAWTLVVTASRGGEALKGELGFTVNAPAGGASKKIKTKITIAAPNKVTKGRAFKVYGKVYKGTKAYKRVTVEVYFKSKGTKTYKFMGFAKTTSTGKYAKSFKGKKDGYFKVKIDSTSKTRSAWSPQEFVDVR
ncbi:hypothetical protein OIE66_32665 [Nonomuraea sp. NBC_01738]|uniref:hypothetical protein n=1 Tax=Nonomuraea sp. NBC_01738 TaxID=2976003 RepID=UPI002E15D1C6|nr:hypothetical protein OIE66_32665 [Nonomuraea sp. NBC_01738]